jgi:hypothetical protein
VYSADDFRRTGCVFDDSRRGLARLFHIGVIAPEPAQAGIGVGDGSGNRLIHFVRQRSGKLSHGSCLADACEIRLRLTQSHFNVIAGFLNAPFYLDQPGDQQSRAHKDCESQVDSRFDGWRECPPQKEVVE